MRELRFERAGRLAWHERAQPALADPGDAIVRPFIAARCDGDTLPIHRPVSRALQAGMALGLVDPVVGAICGSVDRTGFPAERVTTLLAPWDDAPAAYTAKTTKVVVHREPLGSKP